MSTTEEEKDQELSKDEAERIVSYLRRTGRLKLSEVLEALASEPSQNQKVGANMLHSVMCQEDHTHEGCTMLDDWADWQDDSHQRWLQTYEKVLAALSIDGTLFQPTLRRALQVSAQLQRVAEDDPTSFKLLLILRGWEVLK